MHIAFIADPLASFRIYKDSTYAMMVEADRRGHTLAYIDQRNIARAPSGIVEAKAWPLALKTDGDVWHALEEPVTSALRDFDAVVMRKDPPFDMEYVYSTYLLESAEAQGARVFNGGRAIRDHNEKFAITEFPELIAPTLVTRDGARIREFHREHGDIILKPLDGMGGMGIFRVTADGMNLGSMIEMLGGPEQRTIMAQRYIPEIVDGDKRILVIDGKPVPFALARIPQGGEVRGNLAAGGRGRAQPLSDRDREIGETVGAKLAGRGLLLIGVDSIGDYLTEINVTSPTCFAEIFEGVGLNVAAIFVDALERAMSAARSSQGTVGLVVIAHAPFAASLFACAEHVYACEPVRCVTIDVAPDAEVSDELERARRAIADVDDGSGVLVLCDLFGATPGNIAAQLAEPGRVEVVAGVNLPMLLRVLCYRNGTSLADMPEKAISGGASGIMKIASTSPQDQRLFPHDPNDGADQ